MFSMSIVSGFCSLLGLADLEAFISEKSKERKMHNEKPSKPNKSGFLNEHERWLSMVNSLARVWFINVCYLNCL